MGSPYNPSNDDVFEISDDQVLDIGFCCAVSPIHPTEVAVRARHLADQQYEESMLDLAASIRQLLSSPTARDDRPYEYRPFEERPLTKIEFDDNPPSRREQSLVNQLRRALEENSEHRKGAMEVLAQKTELQDRVAKLETELREQQVAHQTTVKCMEGRFGAQLKEVETTHRGSYMEFVQMRLERDELARQLDVANEALGSSREANDTLRVQVALHTEQVARLEASMKEKDSDHAAFVQQLKDNTLLLLAKCDTNHAAHVEALEKRCVAADTRIASVEAKTSLLEKDLLRAKEHSGQMFGEKTVLQKELSSLQEKYFGKTLGST